MSLVVAGTRIEIKVSTVRKDMSFKRPQRYWMNIELESLWAYGDYRKMFITKPPGTATDVTTCMVLFTLLANSSCFSTEIKKLLLTFLHLRRYICSQFDLIWHYNYGEVIPSLEVADYLQSYCVLLSLKSYKRFELHSLISLMHRDSWLWWWWVLAWYLWPQ